MGPQELLVIASMAIPLLMFSAILLALIYITVRKAVRDELGHR